MNWETFKKQLLPSQPKMQRFAEKLLGNVEEAEDSVQDAFLRLWNMRNQLAKYKSLEALSMKITKNICLDKLKAKSRNMYDIDKQIMMTNGITPDKKTEFNNAKDIITEAIKALPEQQQVFVWLRDMEEYEFEEIAEITGFKINYIRVNLSRARKKLKDILNKTYNYGL